MADDLVAAAALGDVDGAVGALEGAGRRVGRAHLGEADADGDLAHAREGVALHVPAQPLQRARGVGGAGAAHQHQELLAAEAVQAVAEAEVGAHQPRQQQQHLVADQVAVRVVHGLEVVDVDHRQPAALLVARTPGSGGHHAGRRLVAGAAHEGFVEGLAVEQAGQRVALAVVEQALEVAVHAQDAGDQADLLGVQRHRRVELDDADDLAVGDQREQAARRHRSRSGEEHGLLLLQAGLAFRVGLQARQRVGFRPQRVGGGGAVAGVQVRTRHPAPVAGFADAAVHRHPIGAQQVAQRAHQCDVEHVAIAQAGQLGQVLDDLGHRCCRSRFRSGCRRRRSAPPGPAVRLRSTACRGSGPPPARPRTRGASARCAR